MVRVGTSGWVYPHWRGRFYPHDLKPESWLPFYASHFDTVELNNSFYRLPKRETFERWRSQTPEGFLFSVKGSRLITHMKKLMNVDEALSRFLEAVSGLGEKLAVVLWQLPPNLKANAERLYSFLKKLPKHCFNAVEFRHPSWWQEREIFKVLERCNASHCIPVAPPFPKELANFVTSTVVYLRFHGWNGIYEGFFPDEELAWWAEKVKGWQTQGLTVFAYFNNDINAFAVQNAQMLKQLLFGNRLP
ncbi:MAG: DUF72 domain-containing protein [Candidatus Fervidibacter sp.]|uniref:DUF72 domain-containing protein n=1 Tax=Candidatus Fervidibacter sp. TaxID=3100871 RepID=UPI00404B98A7